jgi:hypothetical protein
MVVGIEEWIGLNRGGVAGGSKASRYQLLIFTYHYPNSLCQPFLYGSDSFLPFVTKENWCKYSICIGIGIIKLYFLYWVLNSIEQRLILS